MSPGNEVAVFVVFAVWAVAVVAVCIKHVRGGRS